MLCFTDMPRCLVVAFGVLGGWSSAALHFVPRIEHEQDKVHIAERAKDHAGCLKELAEARERRALVDLDAVRRRYMKDREHWYRIPTIPDAQDGERIPAPTVPFPTR